MGEFVDSSVLEVLKDAMEEDERFDPLFFERMVVFSSVGVLFGIPSEAVFEILRTRELVIFKVPRTREGIMGMINLRGDILPIVDFRQRYVLENPGELNPFEGVKPFRSRRIVVVSAKGIRFGLHVDQVIGLTHLLKADFVPLYQPMLAFAAQYEGKPICILRLDELF